jgi:hypothetical protein
MPENAAPHGLDQSGHYQRGGHAGLESDAPGAAPIGSGNVLRFILGFKAPILLIDCERSSFFLYASRHTTDVETRRAGGIEPDRPTSLTDHRAEFDDQLQSIPALLATLKAAPVLTMGDTENFA